MKQLWTYIDGKPWPAEKKHRIALLILGSLYALIGFLLWLIIRIWTLSTIDWMICFIGYPILLSWLVYFFYSCRHEFHNGRFCG